MFHKVAYVILSIAVFLTLVLALQREQKQTSLLHQKLDSCGRAFAEASASIGDYDVALQECNGTIDECSQLLSTCLEACKQ